MQGFESPSEYDIAEKQKQEEIQAAKKQKSQELRQIRYEKIKQNRREHTARKKVGLLTPEELKAENMRLAKKREHNNAYYAKRKAAG